MITRTDTDLFELFQRLFGLGDWDESSGEPYWKWKQAEVSKIKRSRQSRNVAIENLATAAYYCKQHHIKIQNFTWLYQHILPALKWQVEQDKLDAQAYLREELERALRKEYPRIEDGWFERLQSAEDVAFVLSQWRAAGRAAR